MGRKGRRLRKLTHELAHRFPQLDDPEATIVDGQVLVDGFPSTNPASLVPVGVPLALRQPRCEARQSCSTPSRRSVSTSRNGSPWSLGASAGGFTRVLLAAGARRVYAVDAGYGQLLGSLRQDARVVNLERTNLGDLSSALVPDVVEVITMDLSYLPIARAAAQLGKLRLAREADLMALVKPVYELRSGVLPTTERDYQAAVKLAADGLWGNGWTVIATDRSPVRGGRGAVEWLLHARHA